MIVWLLTLVSVPPAPCPPSPQCEGLKTELEELQALYDCSQRERAVLEDELQLCKAELEKLSGERGQVRGP